MPPEATAPAAARARCAAAAGRPRVLVADNDVAVGSLLAEVLTRAGLAVERALDGEAARDLARQPGCRVLVCDLDMPRLSGLEVLEGLAKEAAQPAAIVVSGYLDAEVEERLSALPLVRAVLRKPFDLIGFVRLVSSLAAERSEAGTAGDALLQPAPERAAASPRPLFLDAAEG